MSLSIRSASSDGAARPLSFLVGEALLVKPAAMAIARQDPRRLRLVSNCVFWLLIPVKVAPTGAQKLGEIL